LAEESVVIVCPNPECQREIEEPIILTVLSVTPAEEYEACPYCFTRLNQEPPIEQEEAPETAIEQEQVMEEETLSPAENTVQEKVEDSGPGLLKKVRSLIPRSNNSKQEKPPKAEEVQTEPLVEEDLEDENQIEQPEEKTLEKEIEIASVPTKESGFSGCTKAFGYLANRSPETPIPQECLLCPRIVECMLTVDSD
jgi:hypothetical protein